MKTGKKADPVEIFPQGKTRDGLGKMANVSGRTYEKGVEILKKAPKKEIEKVKNGDKSISKLHREIVKKEKKTKLQRVIKKQQVILPKTVQLYNKKFQDVKIALGSVSLIFTDPLYHDEFLSLYKDLAKQAFKVLRDNGSLLCYIGQKNIVKIIAMMGIRKNPNIINLVD